MEEEKAAAYYDELSRKGSGAAKFKQGLGFSSVPSKGSALPSSTSFLSNFVKASSPSTPQNHLQPTQFHNHDQSRHKQPQLQSIQNKLKSKSTQIQNHSKSSRRSRSRSRSRSRDKYSRRRSRERNSRRRSRSGSGDRYSRRSRSRERNSRRRSRSGSGDRHSRRRSRSRERNSRHRSPSESRDRCSRRSRSRERSSRPRSRGEEGGRRARARRGEKNQRNGGVDYGKLIQGYDKMAPAERVKAKMKLQLTETAEKDPTRGTGSGWERFDFDKDATLDDEEIEAAEDDSSLVKHIGQSFRFSAVEARKEDQIKAAHDEAMFGAPSLQLTSDVDEEKEDSPKCTNESAADTSLISNQVISMQQVSWRDRVKKL